MFIAAAAAVAGLERALPYAAAWQRPQGDRRTDALHLLASVLLSSALLRALALACLTTHAEPRAGPRAGPSPCSCCWRSRWRSWAPTGRTGSCTCGPAVLLWPDLSWEDAVGRPGAAGAEPPALWLRQVMRELLRANRVQLGSYQRDQPRLAGLTYLIPSG